jgi:hypothetical protein
MAVVAGGAAKVDRAALIAHVVAGAVPRARVREGVTTVLLDKVN